MVFLKKHSLHSNLATKSKCHLPHTDVEIFSNKTVMVVKIFIFLCSKRNTQVNNLENI